MNGRWLISFLAFSILSTPIHAADKDSLNTSNISDTSITEAAPLLTDTTVTEEVAKSIIKSISELIILHISIGISGFGLDFIT